MGLAAGVSDVGVSSRLEAEASPSSGGSTESEVKINMFYSTLLKAAYWDHI